MNKHPTQGQLNSLVLIDSVSRIHGVFFLINMDKYKSGKRKGEYKYIKFKGLKWGK